VNLFIDFSLGQQVYPGAIVAFAAEAPNVAWQPRGRCLCPRMLGHFLGWTANVNVSPILNWPEAQIQNGRWAFRSQAYSRPTVADAARRTFVSWSNTSLRRHW